MDDQFRNMTQKELTSDWDFNDHFHFEFTKRMSRDDALKLQTAIEHFVTQEFFGDCRVFVGVPRTAHN